MAGNLAAPLLDSIPAEPFEFPTIYVDDVVSPILVSYELDLDNGNVSLTFDETVDYTDLLARAITFYDDSENDTESFTLTGNAGSDTMINWIYVQFYITEQDQIQIKYRENLLTSVNSTWLENTINLIEDLNNRDAAARGAGERLQASSFRPDVTQPLLTEFHFDLGPKTITLVSNEPIYLPSVYPPGITLLSSSSINDADTSNFTLTNATVSYDQPDANLKRRVQILLTDEDVLVLQLDVNLADGMSNTYISIENGTFQDMFGNDVIGVPLTNALQASSFTEDEDEADLLGYTIDLVRRWWGLKWT